MLPATTAKACRFPHDARIGSSPERVVGQPSLRANPNLAHLWDWVWVRKKLAVRRALPVCPPISSPVISLAAVAQGLKAAGLRFRKMFPVHSIECQGKPSSLKSGSLVSPGPCIEGT